MSKSPQRLDRAAWAEAALYALAEHGLRGVAVEPVARRLGVTKGSFYWHFDARADLLAAALQLWEQLATDRVIDELDRVQDPADRLIALFMQALSDEGLAIERGLLAASVVDSAVSEVYARVSTRRHDYVVRLFREAGLDAAQAQAAGTSSYAEYVGLLQLASLHPDWLTPAAIEARARRAMRP